MKKNLISRLLMLVAITAFMVSCTKKSSEYTNVIPADASAVVGIHTQSLIDKSGVNDEDKQKLINALKGEMNAATFQQVEKIIKDGSASGLSTKAPIYFFTSNLLSSPAVTMKVSDIDKFNKTLEVILPEISNEVIATTSGFSTFKFDGGICAFNESTLLIIESGYDEKIVADLMKQDKEQSVAQNSYFESMSGKKGDVTFFFTLDALPNMYKRQMKTTLNGMENVDPRDIAVIGGLSFEKGRIAVQVETTSDKKEVAPTAEA